MAYEDLVADPVAELTALGRFLGFADPAGWAERIASRVVAPATRSCPPPSERLLSLPTSGPVRRTRGRCHLSFERETVGESTPVLRTAVVDRRRRTGLGSVLAVPSAALGAPLDAADDRQRGQHGRAQQSSPQLLAKAQPDECFAGIG